MKNNLSRYGWIIILILILALLVSLASPFGTYISNAALYATDSFLGVAYNALKLDRPILGGEECFYADKYGTLQIKPAYRELFVPRLLKEVADSDNISVDELCKGYMYVEFTGADIEVEDWMLLGISDKELDEVCGAALLDNLGLESDIENALITYPHMETKEQVMLNYIYLFLTENFASSVPGGLTYDAHNVTRSELDEYANEIAAQVLPYFIQELRSDFPDAKNNDEIIFSYIAYEMMPSVVLDVERPNRKTLNKLALEFNTSQYLVNYVWDILDRVLNHPEKITADDLLFFVSTEMGLIGVDALVDLVKDVPAFDHNKMFLFVPFLGGLTIDDVVEYSKTPALPSRFNIPAKYGDVTISRIPEELFYRQEHIEAVHLPDTIKRIDEMAFGYCRSLTQINLENVETLEPYAFQYTALEHIELSPNLNEIPQGCFLYSGLKYVLINHGPTQIGENAFYRCDNLELVYIPNSVTSIHHYSFHAVRAVIYTPVGSAAEEYAKEHNKPYINANSPPKYFEELRK